MSFLISDHELCEYLVLNYKAILIKETIKLNKYNQYIHLNRYLQRHPKRIFITLGDRNIHFFQVEIPDHTIPTLIQTQSHILTHDSTLFLDTIDASCLLITDENINFNLIYLIATFKVLKIIDHKIVQLQEPSQDCIDAFYTTFNLKHGNINQTLQSLCCIIQLSLVYLGLLDNKLVDGILCDATTNAFKQFIASQYTENNKELKLWSLTSIKILVMKIAWIKRRLKKAGFKILKDVYAYPEFMFKSLKRFQKSRQLDVTHIADEATLTKLESAKRSIKLTQPVQAVTGAVSNIKNKFEEFSGLRYEPEDDDSDSISDSSPLSSNALHFDLNVHIKQILKRQLLSQTKVSKKRIKLPKFTLDTKREISGLPNKLLSGLKSTTARTFEEIAQKSKKWEKGVRHFVGRNSDSESLGVYSDMYLDSNDVYLSTEDEINTPIIKRTKNDFNSESGIQAHQSGTSYSRSECEVYVSSQENESGDMANYSERDSKLYSPMIQPVNIHVEVSEYDSMDEKMSLITGQIDALYIEMQVFDRIDDALDKQIETLTRMLNEKNESVQEFGRRVEEVDKKRGILENRGFEDDVEKTEYSLEMVQEKTTEFESDVRQIIDKVKKVGC